MRLFKTIGERFSQWYLDTCVIVGFIDALMPHKGLGSNSEEDSYAYN